jgi:predicted XRE-type DNA-binding protein
LSIPNNIKGGKFMQRANEEIRRALGANGLKQWQIAQVLEIREETLSKKLRSELKPEEREKILSVIKALANEGV